MTREYNKDVLFFCNIGVEALVFGDDFGFGAGFMWKPFLTR